MRKCSTTIAVLALLGLVAPAYSQAKREAPVPKSVRTKRVSKSLRIANRQSHSPDGGTPLGSP
jgi:hypothetical protein